MVKRSKRLRLSRGKFHHTLKKPPKRRQSCTPSAYVFLRLINVLKKVRCVFFCLKRVLIKALHLFTLVRLDFRIQSEAAVNSPAFLIFKPLKAVVTAFEISGSFRIEQPIAEAGELVLTRPDSSNTLRFPGKCSPGILHPDCLAFTKAGDCILRFRMKVI